MQNLTNIICLVHHISDEELFSNVQTNDLVVARTMYIKLLSDLFPKHTQEELIELSKLDVDRSQIPRKLERHKTLLTINESYAERYDQCLSLLAHGSLEEKEPYIHPIQKEIIANVSLVFSIPFSRWCKSGRRDKFSLWARMMAVCLMKKHFKHDTYASILKRVGLKGNHSKCGRYLQKHDELMGISTLYAKNYNKLVKMTNATESELKKQKVNFLAKETGVRLGL